MLLLAFYLGAILLAPTDCAVNYNTGDQARSEIVDKQGNIQGQYNYRDRNGTAVSVKYSSGKEGFQNSYQLEGNQGLSTAAPVLQPQFGQSQERSSQFGRPQGSLANQPFINQAPFSGLPPGTELPRFPLQNQIQAPIIAAPRYEETTARRFSPNAAFSPLEGGPLNFGRFIPDSINQFPAAGLNSQLLDPRLFAKESPYSIPANENRFNTATPRFLPNQEAQAQSFPRIIPYEFSQPQNVPAYITPTTSRSLFNTPIQSQANIPVPPQFIPFQQSTLFSPANGQERTATQGQVENFRQEQRGETEQVQASLSPEFIPPQFAVPSRFTFNFDGTNPRQGPIQLLSSQQFSPLQQQQGLQPQNIGGPPQISPRSLPQFLSRQ